MSYFFRLNYNYVLKLIQIFKFKDDETKDDEDITPSKIAILDCLLNQSEALSLKAYFIEKLPDLKDLKYELRYMNLSYNNFKVMLFLFFKKY